MALPRFDDLSLHYLVNRADDTERPMVILLHGRGADMHDLADLAPLLDTREGVRFVFPNAPKPFEPYPGETFGWTWFEGWPPSHESVTASRDILLRFIDEVTARYRTPEGKLILSGFSQGAMMALDAGLRTEKQLAGLIAMSGGLYDRDLPDLRSRAGLPLFIAHGSYDDVVPVTYARRARLLLEQAGLNVEYHEYAMAHQVLEEEALAVKDFIARTV
jgi:phospholipase/carboxylesterase